MEHHSKDTAGGSTGGGVPDIKEWSSLIGIVIAICGNVLISIALNVQKYAHVRIAREAETRKNEERQSKGRRGRRRNQNNNYDETDDNDNVHDNIDDAEDGAQRRVSWESNRQMSRGRVRRDNASDETQHDDSTTASPPPSSSSSTPAYLRSYWWWIGIILMSVGECGNFLAYGFAPASIVSPLGVIALISNCIIAPVMLKEPFRKRDFIGIVIAVAGAVVVALSSSPEEQKLGPREIWEAISQTAFKVYFGVTVGLIVVLLWMSRRYGEKWVLVDLGLVGLFGGYTALSTKGVSSLLSTRLYRVFKYPIFYLLLFILVSTAVLQIKYINRALQRWNSTQVIPTQFVLFTLSVIIGSAVLYKDFEKADGPRMAKFVSGCFLTFLGVYLITTGRSGRATNRNEDDYSESNDDEDNESYTDNERYVDEEDAGSDRDWKPKIILSQNPSQEDINNQYKDRESPSYSPSADGKHEQNRSTTSRASSMAISEYSDSPLPPIRPPLDTLRSKSYLSSRSNKMSSRPASSPYIRPSATTSASTETTPLFPYHTAHRPKTISSRDSLPPPPSAPFSSTSVPPQHRSSMSLITPGPLFVGYQLQAVVAARRENDLESGGGGGNNASSKKRAELRKTRSHGGGMTTTTAAERRKRSPSELLQVQDELLLQQQQQQQQQPRRGTVAEAEGLASSSSGL